MKADLPTRATDERIVLFSIAFLHALLFAWIVVQPLGNSETLIAVKIGILIGQNATAVILCLTAFNKSGCGDLNSGQWLVRHSIPWVIAPVCWYGLSQIAVWGQGAPGAAWWAIEIVSQTFSVILLTAITKNSLSTLRFPIRSLIFVTTITAFGFAIAEYGNRTGMWSYGRVRSDDVAVMMLLGLSMGINSRLCLAVVAAKSFRSALVRLSITSALIALSGIGIDNAAVWSGMNSGTASGMVMALFFSQAACVTVTLALARHLPRLLSSR